MGKGKPSLLRRPAPSRAIRCMERLTSYAKFAMLTPMSDLPKISDKISGAPLDPGAPPDGVQPAAADGASSGALPDAPPNIEPVVDVGIHNFAAEVLEPSQRGVLVLLDAWAQWCAPCKQLTPALEEIARTSQGRVRLAKVDIDKEVELAQQMQVRSVPTVLAVKEGKVVDGFVGALPKDEIAKFLEKHVDALPAEKRAQTLADAKARFAAGSVEEAQELFLEVLREAPRDAAALGGLAQCYVTQNDLAQAREVLEMVEAAYKSHSDVAAAAAQLELAQSTPAAPDAANTAALEEQLRAEPNAHETRFQLALAHHQAGARAQAIEHLLQLAQAAPKWNDGAARAQLLKLFAAYGPDDEAVKAGRRRLSTLLFR